MERGFSLTLDKKGNIISTGKQAETIDTFFIKYSDKKVEVSPLKNQEKPSKKIKQQRNKNFQGNLFGE